LAHSVPPNTGNVSVSKHKQVQEFRRTPFWLIRNARFHSLSHALRACCAMGVALTLQDRLVKELRLREISTVAAAHA
jgi:hypothetical protein